MRIERYWVVTPLSTEDKNVGSVDRIQRVYMTLNQELACPDISDRISGHDVALYHRRHPTSEEGKAAYFMLKVLFALRRQG